MAKPKLLPPEVHSLPEILTPQELADALRISKKAAGRLPIRSAKIGRFRRYLRKDVLAYIDGKAS